MNALFNTLFGNARNNNSSNNAKAELNNLLMDGLAKRLGLKQEKARKPKFERAFKPTFEPAFELEIEIEIEVPKKKAPKFQSAGLSYCPGNCSRCPKRFGSLYSEWNTFIAVLESMALRVKPDYDFRDMFGRPVRIFSNYIQVGYDIIPKYVEVTEIEYLSIETRDLMISMITESKKYVAQY